jgi:hypothetical protein
MIRALPVCCAVLGALVLVAAPPSRALAQFGVPSSRRVEPTTTAPPPDPSKPYVGPDGHQHDTVSVHCNAELGHDCYFAILRAKGGVKLVKLGSHLQLNVDDLEIGKDLFTAMVDNPPPTSLSVCRAEASDTIPCRWGVLKVAINEAGNR